MLESLPVLVRRSIRPPQLKGNAVFGVSSWIQCLSPSQGNTRSRVRWSGVALALDSPEAAGTRWSRSRVNIKPRAASGMIELHYRPREGACAAHMSERRPYRLRIEGSE